MRGTKPAFWTIAWRTEGLVGVAEGTHPGATRRLAPAAAEAALGTLLAAGDPQAQGDAAATWTVPRHADRAGAARVGDGRAGHPAHAAPAGLALEAAPVRLGVA